MTSKIHLACEGRLRPFAVLAGPGQADDAPAFTHVIAASRVPRPAGGRPHTGPQTVVADRAYSSRTIRAHLRRRGIRHTIPEPRGLSLARNEAEGTINRLKAFRAVAFDAIRLWLRP
ncbi:transposase [Streptomycetaceae bacterium NBC_01309]